MTETSGRPRARSDMPGRLGDPTLELAGDPRSDPRMIAAFSPFQLDRATPTPPVERSSPLEAQLSFVDALEAGFESAFASTATTSPSISAAPEVRAGHCPA